VKSDGFSTDIRQKLHTLFVDRYLFFNPGVAMEIPQVSSRIDSVTVYRKGARIKRVADLSKLTAASQIRLTNLPLAMDDASIKVRVAGTNGTLPVASDLRVTLEVPSADTSLPPAEDAALRAAREEVVKLRDRLEQNRSETARLEAIALPSRGKEKDKSPIPVPTEARVKLLEFQQEQLAALLQARQALEVELTEAERKRQDLEAKFAQATSARQPREHELRKAVIVTLRNAPQNEKLNCNLELEYLVPGARWAPAYTFRFDRDFTKAEVSMRALVAQKTGEDWNSARLTLSTAHAQAWTELEELSSLRIGRKQAPPARKGWREAPEVPVDLYSDFDRANSERDNAWVAEALTKRDETAVFGGAALAAVYKAAETSSASIAGDMTVLEEAPADREVVARRAAPTRLAAMARAAPPPPPARPAQAPRPGAVAAKSIEMFRERMAPATAAAPMDLSSETTIFGRELTPSDRMLNYGHLRMPAPDAPHRGKLELISDEALYVEMLTQLKVEVSFSVAMVMTHAVQQALTVEQRPPPLRCRFPETVDGFDYAYTTPAPADLPSDGEFHSIPIFSEAADARSSFVCVPREALDVFRFVELKNPLSAPLLEGPADIHAGGDFLMTTLLHTVPPSGQIRMGLGVEQAIKVARNTTFSEDAAGIMGGSLELKHEVKIDIVSHLKQPAQIEVRERIPALQEGEEQAKLVVAQVTPDWEALKHEYLRPGEESLKGGHRWLLSVEPGKPRQLKANYVIQISAKNELAGGNRREG
jgi:hypothetical protein